MVVRHLHCVAAELGLCWWALVPILLLIAVPLLATLLHSSRYNFGVPCRSWPLCLFNVLRVATHRIVLGCVGVVIHVSEFARVSGVIARKIMSVGPTIPVIVVPFDVVRALCFAVVLWIAVVVLEVVAVSGPRAIVLIAVAFSVAVAVAVVAVVAIVVVVVVVILLLLRCVRHWCHLHLHGEHLLLDLWQDAVELRVG